MNRKELNSVYRSLLNESPLPPEVQDQDWEQHPEWFPGAEHETSPFDPDAPVGDPWFDYWWWWYHHWHKPAPDRPPFYGDPVSPWQLPSPRPQIITNPNHPAFNPPYPHFPTNPNIPYWPHGHPVGAPRPKPPGRNNV